MRHTFIAGEQLGEFVRVEPEQRPVDAGALELGDLDRQQFHVPGREFARLVVSDAIRPNLLRSEVGGDVYGHLGKLELLRGLEPSVPADDDALVIDHDGLAETELSNRGGDCLDGGIVLARVLLVRGDVIDRALDDLHGHVPPCRRESGQIRAPGR